MITLKYQQDYKSIKKFQDVELEDFTVLTGINGSGKSHLLAAIEQRKVKVENIEDIVLFNYETFKLENETPYNGQIISQEKEQAWKLFTSQIKNNIQSFKNRFNSEQYQKLVNLSSILNKPLFKLKKDDLNDDNLWNILKSYKRDIKIFFKNNHNLKNSYQAQSILVLIENLTISIDEITEEAFKNYYKPFQFKQDFLPVNLGKIIWNYYIKYDENERKKYENEKKGKKHKILTDEEFFKIYDEKPWEIINLILSEFSSLKFEIDSPENYSIFDTYSLKIKNPDGIEISFNDLSSGEKILMSLVASIYKSQSDKHFPELLLLDEIDATLHPSMIKNLIKVIQKIFLENGVKVILVTHSPTTVALVPDNSVFVMNKSGLNRIKKVDKNKALSILTEGYATLSEGLTFIDEIARNNLTIITEGKNTKYIKKYLELNNIKNVEVLSGVEGNSGKTQIKTLYDFLKIIEHKNKVLFVWDCDVNEYRKEEEKNNTYIFIFNKTTNSIAKKGIENLFDESLFDNFYTEVKKSDGTIIKNFEENRKNEFLEMILNRNNINDFKNFKPLLEKINTILDNSNT